MKRQAESSPTPGNNHTGLAPHPKERDEMARGAQEFKPTSSGGPDAIAQLRIAYARAGGPHGTMSAAAVDPARLPVLDKLGARLQFERTGTRLYDALISKLDAYGVFDGGPTRQQLLELRDQEHAHALLAQDLIRALGGDPTMVTPCGNLQATASRGIVDVLGHAEASRRGWERGDHGQSGWFGDPEGHSEASRRGWERGDHGQSGWFGDSRGHAEASRRGWEHGHNGRGR